MTLPHEDPERKKVLALYALLILTVVMTLVPHLAFVVVSTVLLVAVLALAYVVRAKALPDGLAANHMTYIIRTIWLSSGLAVVTTGIASALLIYRMDETPVQPCTQKLAEHVLGNSQALESTDIAGLASFLDPCMEPFMQANMGALIMALVIAAGPLLFYVALRMIKGVSRAHGGYRVAHPQAWL